MKKLMSLILVLALALSAVGVMAAEEGLTVTVNGVETPLDVADVDGTVYLPLRALCESMGCQVGWEGETQTATVIMGGSKIEIPIGESFVRRDGLKTAVPAANRVIDGKTYVCADAVKGFGGAYTLENNVLAVSAPVLDGKYVRVVHKASGRVLAPQDGSKNDSAAILAEEPNDEDYQVWKLVSRGGGMYRLENRSTSRAIDVPSDSKDPGRSLIQYGITGGTNQYYSFIGQGDGSYLVQCGSSKLYVTVDAEGKVTQEELTGGDGQLFTLDEVEYGDAASQAAAAQPTEADPLGGRYFVIYHIGGPAKGGAEPVSVRSLSARPGALGLDYGKSVWHFILRGKGRYVIADETDSLMLNGAAVEEMDLSSAPEYEIVPIENTNGGYYIKSGENYLTYYFVGDGHDGFEFAPLKSGGKPDYSQIFTLGAPVPAAETSKAIGGRYMAVVSAATDKALDIEDASAADSAKVTAANYYVGDACQRWTFVQRSADSYVLINKNSGKAIDIPGGSEEPGIGAIQYSPNYNDNQVFAVESDGETCRLRNKNSGLYLTVTEAGVTQEEKSDSADQRFILRDTGESDIKLMGATATLFLLKGEDAVNNVKLQWSGVPDCRYRIFRSEDGRNYEYVTSTGGLTVDDYGLEIGKTYTYRVYAMSGGVSMGYAQTTAVTPYYLPADLKSASNLEPSNLDTPSSLRGKDGTYYRLEQWGRDDGGSGFGRLMLYTSQDGVNYSEPEEVLNYKEILAHETCKDFDMVRFESNNYAYNPVTNQLVFIAHMEGDGGYGTARTSFVTGTPGERFTFHGAYRPGGTDDTRDLNIFIDDYNNTAYLMAAIYGNASMGIYRLNPEWSGIEERVAVVNENRWRELPNIIKVNGIYYLFTSGTAGWYPTPGKYNSAANMAGPWSDMRSVGNTTTFSGQSGAVFALKKGGANYIMAPYRWMYYWQDSIMKSTQVRRYPITVSDGYAFYDFFEELLYDYDRDILVPVQRGRIISQDKPAGEEGMAKLKGLANDGNYDSKWATDTKWPYTWEVDLGESYSLTQAQISWMIWNSSEAYYQYIIEGSEDGVNYTTLVDHSSGYTDYGFTVDELSGRARYVRVTVLDAKLRSSDENNYPSELYEIKILGK